MQKNIRLIDTAKTALMQFEPYLRVYLMPENKKPVKLNRMTK